MSVDEFGELHMSDALVIERLKAELEDLRKEYARVVAVDHAWGSEEVERLRDALAWYADEGNYSYGVISETCVGQRARDALDVIG